ncbi:hypothetical protein [Streptomyces coryli]|nr:hypothetical protein [Streptomyces coryli]
MTSRDRLPEVLAAPARPALAQAGITRFRAAPAAAGPSFAAG